MPQARPILFQRCQWRRLFPSRTDCSHTGEARYRSPPRGGLGCQRVLPVRLSAAPSGSGLRSAATAPAGDPVWQSLRGYHQLLRSLICLLAKFQRGRRFHAS
uniref:Secreted protein n=1 Tax=Macrostomum lignano TaxID=282301 RepID=A0A1I8FLZ3_9PLAT